MPQHLKCLSTVIYDLPLITIPVSNCHLFSEITISQGIVAMRLRCVGIFSYHFTANLSPSQVTAMSLVNTLYNGHSEESAEWRRENDDRLYAKQEERQNALAHD